MAFQTNLSEITWLSQTGGMLGIQLSCVILFVHTGGAELINCIEYHIKITFIKHLNKLCNSWKIAWSQRSVITQVTEYIDSTRTTAFQTNLAEITWLSQIYRWWGLSLVVEIYVYNLEVYNIWLLSNKCDMIHYTTWFPG